MIWTGNSLLTSFYVVPELVGSAWSELNSRGRLLFVANHPERFADSVVTEIVGYSDENGDSPFWDAIGRNFFDLNYAAAERLCGLKSRTFLAELDAALPDLRRCCLTPPKRPWGKSTRVRRSPLTS